MNLKIFVLIIFFALSCTHESSREPSSATSAKYGLHATPLSLSYKRLQSTENVSFWKIIPYYRTQNSDASCSVASVTMVINALIPSYQLNSESKLFSEDSLLKISNSKLWVKAVSQNGKGMTLQNLSKEVNALLPKLNLNAYHSGYREILTDADSDFFKEALTKQMNGEGWIILNYDQGLIMGNGSYGHFSPVASYHLASNQILILDTDAQWYEPYWVSFDKIIEGMKTYDNELKNPRGFLWILKR